MSDKLIVYKCSNGHLCYPKHSICSKCGVSIRNEEVDLSNLKGTVVTWTKSTVPPPGVRKPNIIAIVEYYVEGETVALLGGIEGESVSIGDIVNAIPVSNLRDTEYCQREKGSQTWSGHRFKIVE